MMMDGAKSLRRREELGSLAQVEEYIYWQKGDTDIETQEKVEGKVIL